MLHVFWLLVGLVLLTAGGESLVRGALALARRLNVSPLLAGLVIVGFGTSAPELIVSVQAALKGQTDIAIGNVLGSNIANIWLILGVSALIMPMVTHLKCLRRDGLTMLLATVLFMVFASFGGLNAFKGSLMLLVLFGYLFWAYFTEKEDSKSPEAKLHEAESNELTVVPMSLPLMTLAVLGGLAMLMVGANRFLLGAVGLGEVLGVPQSIIGLTLVAVGTSLPEFAVSIIAALRRHADVAVGNVIGSNIFNLLCILGVSSLISPLPLAGRLLEIDQFVMLSATLVLLGFLYFGLSVSRLKGMVMLLLYLIYVGLMFGLAPT